MWRILFVDDDAKILAGLSRMLRGLRNEWEMVFADGPRQALEYCAVAPFDVVISDARMPGMDGAQLLGEVLRLYPDAARIMLSGQYGRDEVLKCVGVAHQFLSKPCDPDVLKSTVRRVCDMRSRCCPGTSARAMSGIGQLPSGESACAALTAEMASSNAGIERVAEIFAHDVAMGATAVRLVSSGFLGPPQRVADAAHAARLLGLETIKALWDTADVFVSSRGVGASEEIVDFANRHTRVVADAAKAIVQSVTDDRVIASDAHLSGMLHGISVLALAGRRPEAAAERDALYCSNPVELRQSPCPEADAYLAALWGNAVKDFFSGKAG